MTTNTQVQKYVNTGSLTSFLTAVFFGIAVADIAALTLNIVILLSIAIIIFVIRHLSDWITALLGALAGIALVVLLGVNLLGFALLVVIYGAKEF